MLDDSSSERAPEADVRRVKVTSVKIWRQMEARTGNFHPEKWLGDWNRKDNILGVVCGSK